MILLSGKNLSKSFGVDEILKDITINIQEGEKIGVVGNNGAGKSTLFKILTGEMKADSGEIITARDLALGSLRQTREIPEDITLYDYCLESFNHLIQMEKNLRDIEASLAVTPGSEALMERYALALDEFNLQHGYSYESYTRGILLGLGFSEEDFTRSVDSLSGGQRTRLDLAKLLLIPKDLLLLDEPTNHLDIEAVGWLENFLVQYAGAVVLISHDRFFLDRVVTRIYEVEQGHGQLYPTNYSGYIAMKRERYEINLKHYEKQQLKIRQEENLIRSFKERGTEKLAKRARDREHKLNRIIPLEKPFWSSRRLNLNFHPRVKSGYEVLKGEGLSFSFGAEPLFKDLEFTVYQGDRIGLIGANGIGKTTLFRLLVGNLAPGEGRITYGHHVHTGYYDQELDNLNPHHTLMEEIHSLIPHKDETVVRNYLGAFLFVGDEVFKQVAVLSGGEKSRLSLLKLMLSQNNFLLLDEPTNHLDIISRETLENALLNYEGTLFAISHDRYFLNRVCNKIIDFTKEGLTVYLGNYDDYVLKKERLRRIALEAGEEGETTKTSRKEAQRKNRRAMTHRKNQEAVLLALEETIHRLESRVEEIHELQCLEEVYTRPSEMSRLAEELSTIEEDLKTAYADWEKLL